jgi:hypothetical protein
VDCIRFANHRPPASERITRSINADWGIYIKCLETSEEIAIAAEKQMDTISVFKIPLPIWATLEGAIRTPADTYGQRTTARKVVSSNERLR